MNEIKENTADQQELLGEEVTVLSPTRAAAGDHRVLTETSGVLLGPISGTSESRRTAAIVYLLLPLVLLTVALLGGLRLSSADSSFIFIGPPLSCLILAVMLLALFGRSGIIRLDGWFSRSYSFFRNVSNGWLLFTLFAASTQIFNSMIPEQGLPFWVVSFCFFWTVWNNLFADFDPRRLLKSLGALFGLAFVAKYIVLANLTAPEGGSWLTRILENPGRETFTWLLDLPRFSSGTGYIQFFAAALYFFGLLMLPPVPGVTVNADRD